MHVLLDELLEIMKSAKIFSSFLSSLLFQFRLLVTDISKNQNDRLYFILSAGTRISRC